MVHYLKTLSVAKDLVKPNNPTNTCLIILSITLYHTFLLSIYEYV